jgi:hypothetical protein
MAKERHILTREDRVKGGKASGRGPSITTLIEKYGNTVNPENKDGLTYLEMAALKLVKKAADDEEHIGWNTQLIDRLAGKSIQQIKADVNHNADNDEAIEKLEAAFKKIKDKSTKKKNGNK